MSWARLSRRRVPRVSMCPNYQSFILILKIYDTSVIRIDAVSAPCPYRTPHAARVFPCVSVFKRWQLSTPTQTTRRSREHIWHGFKLAHLIMS